MTATAQPRSGLGEHGVTEPSLKTNSFGGSSRKKGSGSDHVKNPSGRNANLEHGAAVHIHLYEGVGNVVHGNQTNTNVGVVGNSGQGTGPGKPSTPVLDKSDKPGPGKPSTPQKAKTGADTPPASTPGKSDSPPNKSATSTSLPLRTAGRLGYGAETGAPSSPELGKIVKQTKESKAAQPKAGGPSPLPASERAAAVNMAAREANALAEHEQRGKANLDQRASKQRRVQGMKALASQFSPVAAEKEGSSPLLPPARSIGKKKEPSAAQGPTSVALAQETSSRLGLDRSPGRAAWDVAKARTKRAESPQVSTGVAPVQDDTSSAAYRARRGRSRPRPIETKAGLEMRTAARPGIAAGARPVVSESAEAKRKRGPKGPVLNVPTSYATKES